MQPLIGSAFEKQKESSFPELCPHATTTRMRIAIIGGGAAGLMTAATLLESSAKHEVFLIEKNDGLGKKVIISGGGRCNVTTGIQEVRAVLQKYPRGGAFLTSAMYAFPPAATHAWFEDHGVPLKTEEDLRVFPASDNGHDIVGVFEQVFAATNIHVWLRCAAERVERLPEGFHIFFKNRLEPLFVEALVLTTGGQAYRHTGSTGDGYAFAQTLGHSLTPLAPSLNAFFTRETWPKEISGLSFPRATLTALRGNHPAFTGPILFTHKGLTGPAVFALSGKVAFETYTPQEPLKIHVDLLPDVSMEQALADLELTRQETPKKSFENILALFLPKSFAHIACEQTGTDGDQHAGEISKKELMTLVQWLKAIPLHVVARGAGDEFVTAGGIPLSEVDPRTMESRLCQNLFFAGEILDIDGFTGGFNLQASWATGHLAGSTLAER